MMRALRDKKTMHVILWILLFVFVFFGIFVGFGVRSGSINNRNDSAVYAAKVGDGGVSLVDFNRTYQQALEKIYSSNPRGPSNEETKDLQNQILNALIDNTILEQTAKSFGINVSDDELRATLGRYFPDKNGNVDKDKYNQFLQNRQLTADEFESEQRKEMLLQKIHSVLYDGILFSADEADHYSSLLNRDLKAAYVLLDLTSFEKSVPVKEDDLKEFYESSKDKFDHPERVKIRHIFISGDQAEGFQNPEAAQKSLEEFREQVLSGKKKFEDLAKKYSSDNQTKTLGGEIGWVERGNLVKDFEDVVFNLKKGKISKPFKLQNGYDVVQVEDYEKAFKSTFVEVRPKVLKQYQEQQATQKILTLSEELNTKLKDNESLEKVSKELGLSVVKTDWFNRKTGIPRVENSKDISREIASLYTGDWKGPLPLQQKEYFFQIIETREGKDSSTLTDKERSDLAEQMLYDHQETWLKEFMGIQRKKLGVKTYLNS